MVLHAGLECYKKTGSLITYENETGIENSYDTIAVGPNDINGVELFEIRKKFIDAALNLGFVKAEITDWCSMTYHDVFSRLMFRIKWEWFTDYAIWIFVGKKCYVWEKGSGDAELVDEYGYFDTPESLKWIRKESQTKPEIIIYSSIYRTNKNTVQKIFKDARVYNAATNSNSTQGLLVKARIMARDEAFLQFNTEPMLEREIQLKIGGKLILYAVKWQLLPFSLNKRVRKPNGVNTLEISSPFNKTQKKLPDVNEFSVQMDIDVNGICSVTFITPPEIFSKFPISKEKCEENNDRNDSEPILEANTQVYETKEMLKALRAPMIKTELFSSETHEELSPSFVPQINTKSQKKSEFLEADLMPPPPSYAESQSSYSRQASPTPSHMMRSPSPSQKSDADVDPISKLREQIQTQNEEYKRLLISHLTPKIADLTATGDLKKVCEMMFHKDVTDLFELHENNELLKTTVLDALYFLHGSNIQRSPSPMPGSSGRTDEDNANAVYRL
uniref:Uncharacterized protein n=1 Tax=Panagrolaimus sp. PS1159 TaxID=55785 RepID=A0AC35G156_9BILA